MKLIFNGHDYRYAVEQSLLAFFPTERPLYEGDDPNTATVTLTIDPSQRQAAAVTTLSVANKTACGTSQIDLPETEDIYERERLLQRAVKLSFFQAARTLTGVTPAWGALTGIRPAKLAAGFLDQPKPHDVFQEADAAAEAAFVGEIGRSRGVGAYRRGVFEIGRAHV